LSRARTGGRSPAILNWRLVPEREAQGVARSVLSLGRDIIAHRWTGENHQTLFREMMDAFALHEILREGEGRPADDRFMAVTRPSLR
jgi:hypothetical protein